MGEKLTKLKKLFHRMQTVSFYTTSLGTAITKTEREISSSVKLITSCKGFCGKEVCMETEKELVFSARELTAILFGKDPRFNPSLKAGGEIATDTTHSFDRVDPGPCESFMKSCQDYFVLSSPKTEYKVKIKGNLGIYFISQSSDNDNGDDYSFGSYFQDFYLDPKKAIEEAKLIFFGIYDTHLKMEQIKPFVLLDREQILDLQRARDTLLEKQKKEREERKKELEEEEKSLPHITVEGCLYNLNTQLSGVPFVTNGRRTSEETENLFAHVKDYLDANQKMTPEEIDHGVPQVGNHLQYVYKEVGLNLEKFVSLVGSIPPRKLTQGEFELLVDMVSRTFQSALVHQKEFLEKKEFSTIQDEKDGATKTLALSFLFSSWLAKDKTFSNGGFNPGNQGRIAFATAWWIWSLTHFGYANRPWLENERLLPQLKKLGQQDLDKIYNGKFTLKP